MKYEVYRDGEMIGATVYAEDAAALLATAHGTEIRVDGRIVWDEGAEDQEAGESYDHVAEVIGLREQQNKVAVADRVRKLGESL